MVKKLFGALVILFLFMILMCQVASGKEESPIYYSYIGDKITTSMTPERGKLYFPVVNEERDCVMFYVYMDTESNLFQGDETFVYTYKVLILSLNDDARSEILTSLSNQITKEKTTVSEKVFLFAKTVAEEYVLATQPFVVKANQPSGSLAEWLGYKFIK